MKKRKMMILTLTAALWASAALGGCTAAQSPGRQAAASAPVEQAARSGGAPAAAAADAWESGEEISTAEQARAEQTRRDEVAAQYAPYAPYGLTYDREKDSFFYNGRMVRYFNDPVNEEHANSFFFEDGVVDVEGVRNADGALTGLRQASDADFDARTQALEAREAAFDAAGAAAGSGSLELGDPDSRDDSLAAYTAFGVSYDPTAQRWMYGGKSIHILYDAGRCTYWDASAEDGVCLRVIRGQNGSIERLAEAAAQELEPYIK